MTPSQGMLSATVLVAAIAIDWFLGEPPAAIHPVCWIGRVTRFLLRLAPHRNKPAFQLIFGASVTAIVTGCAFAIVHVTLQFSAPWPWLHHALATAWLTSAFALRGLGRAGAGVRDTLAVGNIDGARVALGSLCSRDARKLTPPLIAAACVESLAENASDSVVAPLFYFAVGGVPLAMAYRAINTLDAMIGYRGKYEYLGKAAARLDDLLNIIPARITAFLLVIAGAIRRADVFNGLRIWARDGRKTQSPNAGHPMAAMAGLLRTRLEKVGHYALGDADRPLTSASIDSAWQIVCVACMLMAMGTAIFMGARNGL